MRSLFSSPLSRWPLRFHAAAACLSVMAVAGVAGLLAYAGAERSNQQRAELRALETRLQILAQDEKKRSAGNFIQTLPPAASADEVVRDMGRHAQTLKIQVASLSIAVTDPSPGLIRKVQFNLTASGDYTAMKSWLAEMLGRYPALGVQTLSLRGLPNDALRQEIQLALVLFVRD
ncbi:hypothetical protein PMI15_01766 [Polaromonas sp. CF318]|uniref:hypothetical protein n=1 Tax=Polaromonas sp. CF318 TaxID=1144318 RepID=UPI0002714C3E|nr:hypothetical protein [Polaromonas sp. CF318]EJL85521.1 hypothetical protein PMI15_01766 [Polaromonas sp. CF318]